MKQKIQETPYKSATKDEVCSHLKPIVKLLEDNGNKVDRLTGIICDKGDGNILLLENDIDFKLIENHFDLPDFVTLNEQKKRVVCSKCWCSFEKKVAGKRLIQARKYIIRLDH